MIEKEVSYRLAKWVLLNMEKDGLISSGEMRNAWEKIAKRYEPPFIGVEDMRGTIGDGVRVDERDYKD